MSNVPAPPPPIFLHNTMTTFNNSYGGVLETNRCFRKKPAGYEAHQFIRGDEVHLGTKKVDGHCSFPPPVGIARTPPQH